MKNKVLKFSGRRSDEFLVDASTTEPIDLLAKAKWLLGMRRVLNYERATLKECYSDMEESYAEELGLKNSVQPQATN